MRPRKKRSKRKRSKPVKIVQRTEPISSYGGPVSHGAGGYVVGEGDIVVSDVNRDDPIEGDYVRLGKIIGSGIGRIVQISPEGDTAIVSLLRDQDPDDSGWEKGFKKGDHVSVNLDDIHVITKSDLSEGIDNFTLKLNKLYRDLNL